MATNLFSLRGCSFLSLSFFISTHTIYQYQLYSQAGYREGITKGRATTLQSGFDQGFNSVGAPIGRRLGILRGLASALVSFLTSTSTSSSSSLLPPSTEKDELVRRARELVKRLATIRLEDLAPPDTEAEQHAREHAEAHGEVPDLVPSKLQEHATMDSLERAFDSLAQNDPSAAAAAAQADSKKGEQLLQECAQLLRSLLRDTGLEDRVQLS
jgi:hypothetical protein